MAEVKQTIFICDYDRCGREVKQETGNDHYNTSASVPSGWRTVMWHTDTPPEWFHKLYCSIECEYNDYARDK